jgi:NAD(P)-dependent dehydrogenase (short-subunit alcohol dehydrogenase family)
MTSVIVTGAGGGLGVATVSALAARGARILAVDLDEQGLDRCAAAAQGPGAVIRHVADVTDEGAVKALVARAIAEFGQLGAIFNNAAVEGPIAEIGDIPVEEYDRTMRINVRSVFLGMKHAVPHLRASRGAILNTASTGGMMGWPGISPYVASKHAVVGLTRAVALENAGQGVRVNVLCPGPMDTRMIWSIGEAMAPGDRPEQQRQLEATIPVGRLGRPEEVASFATWLLLDGPEYLTGAVLPVDGAQTSG